MREKTFILILLLYLRIVALKIIKTIEKRWWFEMKVTEAVWFTDIHKTIQIALAKKEKTQHTHTHTLLLTILNHIKLK